MLPVNVFGNVVSLPGVQVQGHLVTNNQHTNIVISLPIQHIVSMLNAAPGNETNLELDFYRARIVVSGADTHGTPWRNPDPLPELPMDLRGVVHQVGAGIATSGAIDVTLTAAPNNGWSTGQGFVRLSVNPAYTLADLGNLTGHLRFQVPVQGYGYWHLSHLTVRPGTGEFNFTTNWPLAGVGRANVAISVTGGARGFSSALHVPPVRISENQFGVLNNPEGDMVVMLTAPPFYRWSFAPPVGITSVTQDIVFGAAGLNARLEVRAGGVANGASFSNVANRQRSTDFIATASNIAGSTRDVGTGNRIWGTRVGDFGAAHAVHQHRIFIPIGEFDRDVNFRPGLGWLEIRNLWLIPDANAPARGDVNIDVHVGRMGTNHPDPAIAGAGWWNRIGSIPGVTGAGQQVWAWANNQWTLQTQAAPGTINMGPVAAPHWLGTGIAGVVAIEGSASGQRVTGLHVGTRGAADLSVEVHGGPNNVRTGHLGTFRPQNWLAAPGTFNRPDTTGYNTGDWRWNRDNEGTPFFEGVVTSTLIIEENIPGAFSTGFGAPINFAFLDEDGNPHPGIRILGMEARAGNFRHWGWTRGAMNNFWGGQVGVMFPGWLGDLQGYNNPGSGYGAAQGANQNLMNFRGWLSAIDNRVPTAPGVGRLTDTEAVVYLPAQQITQVTPLPDHGNTILEVRFFLSVEAGFEWKYGSNIDVTISGAGVTNLVGANGTYTTTIAHARDPIAMNLVSGVAAVETGFLYNLPAGAHQISDLVIDVVDNAAFAIGEELWIYIGTDTIGRNFDINLLNIPTVHVNAESGLRLDSGRLMAPTAGGHVGRAGVAFTVMRQPYGGNAPAPVITISNIFVEGRAYPGIEYQIIVSGTAVANNDQEVFNATRRRTEAEAAIIARMNRGIFTSLPYNATALENVLGGWDVAPQGPDTGEIPAHLREFRMWAGMGPIAGVTDPFRWVDLPGTNLRVGFVSARAFAYFINGSPDQGVEWDAASGVATISGQDINSNAVQVVLTVGSNIAQINGRPVDIATEARYSGPAGSIQVVPTPDGRIFLPLRFLAQTFGRTVHAEGEVVVFR